MGSKELKFQKINNLVNLGLMTACGAIGLIDHPPIDNVAKLEKIKYLFENAKTKAEQDMYYHFWELLFKEISLKKCVIAKYQGY